MSFSPMSFLVPDFIFIIRRPAFCFASIAFASASRSDLVGFGFSFRYTSHLSNTSLMSKSGSLRRGHSDTK